MFSIFCEKQILLFMKNNTISFILLMIKQRKEKSDEKFGTDESM